jgi:GNAT superfamily N-acetyltransferase
MPMEVVLREMEQRDIEAGLGLCRAAGWNQTERDWRYFLEHSVRGCVAAECEGTVEGTAATLDFGEAFSWVAMVLVWPDQRNRGIGSALLEECLRRLRGRAVRLDATPLGRPVYRRLGFEDEFKLARFLREPAPSPPGAGGCRPLATGDLAAVCAFDERVFGADRSTMLLWLAEGAPDLAWVSEKGAGFCLGRHGHLYDHIGPLVAADRDTAAGLVRFALAQGGTRPVVIDTPLASEAWIDSLRAQSFREQRPFTRMVLGAPAVTTAPEALFAITGPEFA